jgi:hypothetical protein
MVGEISGKYKIFTDLVREVPQFKQHIDMLEKRVTSSYEPCLKKFNSLYKNSLYKDKITV